MIRRMKKEAMVGEDFLPPKRREYVSVAVDPTVMKELNAKIQEREVGTIALTPRGREKGGTHQKSRLTPTREQGTRKIRSTLFHAQDPWPGTITAALILKPLLSHDHSGCDP